MINTASGLVPVPESPDAPYAFGQQSVTLLPPNTWWDVAFDGLLFVTSQTNPGVDDKIQFACSFGPGGRAGASFQLNPGQQSSGTEQLGPLKAGDSTGFSFMGRIQTPSSPTNSLLTMVGFPGGPPSGAYSVNMLSFTAFQVG